MSATSCPQNHCNSCALSSVCLPGEMDSRQVREVDALVRSLGPLTRGQRVFSQNTPFSSCYFVKTGAVKTVTVSERGDERILGFYLPGDVFGLSSMNRRSYSCSAIALEHTSICELPFRQLEQLARNIPQLQHHLFELMSREIANAENVSMLLSSNTAEERVIALLLNISEHHRHRKLSPLQFRLPMSRSDMGSFLGLAVETVSRILGNLHKQGLINITGRTVVLLQPAWLRRRLALDPDATGSRKDDFCWSPGHSQVVAGRTSMSSANTTGPAR